MLALRAIPWTTLLANAPTILRSANALLASTTGAGPQRRSDPGTSRDHMQTLVERLTALEQRDRETAELLSQVTTQIAALTTASEVLEARVRWLLLIAVVSSAVAAIALGMVVSG